jgi:HK97 family phage portal protein
MSLRSWLGRQIGLTDGAFWGVFLGGESSAGKAVNADTAMNLSAANACVRLLSETIGAMPLMVYERLDDGGRRPAKEHWSYALLHDSPNADQTPVEYWEGQVAALALWGNGLARKEKAGGRVVALQPFSPAATTVSRQRNGRLRYSYVEFGVRHDLDEDDVVHIRGFGTDRDWGLSPIAMARHSLGLAMAADEAAAKLFANGMVSSGFIETQKFLTKEQRAQFETSLEKFKGSTNAGKLMTLEGGFAFKPLSINPEDMQMLESRRFNVEEICRWFRVPPFMIGHTEKSTSWGTGIEQQQIGFLTFTLAPYLARIQQRLNASLLSPVDRRKYYVEFNIESLLRADSAGRAAFYSTMAQNGGITRNEIRVRENLPKMPGGDVLTVQSNLVPLEMLGKVPAAPTPPEPPAQDNKPPPPADDSEESET